MIHWNGNEAHHGGAFVGRVMRTAKTGKEPPPWMAWVMVPSFMSLGAFDTIEAAREAVEKQFRVVEPTGEQ